MMRTRRSGRRTLVATCLSVAAIGIVMGGCSGGAPVESFTTDGPVSFRHRVIDPAPPGGEDCCTDVCAAGDLDGDGYLDLVLGSEHATGPGLFWYAFPLWTKHPIASGQFTTDMQTADVDGDGRTDVVVGDSERGLLWYANPGASGTQWPVHVVGAGYVHDLEVGDLDADGDLDFVTGDKQKVIAWLQTTPGEWTSLEVLVRDGEGVDLADLDRDGDLDVVLGGLWLEAPAAPLVDAWQRHDFAPAWNKDARVAVGDINGDGRLDVALTASEGEGPVAWFEAPSDPREGSWAEHRVGALVLTGAHSLQLADLDGDRDLDLVTAEMHTGGKRVLVYLQQPDGWVEEMLGTNGSHNMRAIDLGNDGDIDLIGKNYGGKGRIFEMWENQTRDLALIPEFSVAPGPEAWRYEPLDAARPDDQYGTMGLLGADVNGDGLLDVVAGGLLYLNHGGTGHPFTRVALPVGVDVFFAQDVDGNGRADLVGFRGDQAVWLEAVGPDALKWTERIVAEVPNARTQGSMVAQVIPGGRPELVFTRGMKLFFLQIPALPAGGPWPLTCVSEATEEEAVAVDDLDGDGSLDLITSSADGFHLLAFINPGPQQAQAGHWPATVLATTPGRADRIIAADIDGDGRRDLVVTEESGDLEYNASVSWFGAPLDRLHGRWERHQLVVVRSANSLDVADFDGDGRPDLALAEHTDMKPDEVADDTRTFLLLNRGAPLPWVVVPVDRGPRSSHLGARAFDLDNDGDLDLVSTAWRQYRSLHAWYNPGQPAAN